MQRRVGKGRIGFECNVPLDKVKAVFDRYLVDMIVECC